MYTEEEERKGIPIRNFLVKLILVIIFVLLLVWLLPMPNLTGLNNRIFNSNVQEMKDAAVSYFTTDRLPENVGDRITLTLQEMLDMKLLLPFTDKNGNACDTKDSYVTLEKFEDEYEMKVNLKCGKEEDYILVKLGCYSYCPDGVCEKQNDEQPIVEKGPSCVLVVSSGTLGTNNWYTSNVIVKFKNKTTTTENAKITDYGLGTGSATYNGKTSYTVTEDGTTKVYGYVKDSTGKTAVCSITIKKDVQKPSCDLSVLSGSKNVSGTYTSDVVVGFSNKNDKTSGIGSFGIGTSTTPTYNSKTTHTINTNGTHKVYGYVKDAAGNTAVCDITVKREKTKTTSDPSCVLQVNSGTLGDNGWYRSNVVIGFKSKTTTNGATVTSFGIGTRETYAKNTTYTLSSDGTIVVYGYVKDSNGNTATCSTTVKRDVKKPDCSLKVTSGTYNSNGYYTSNVVVGFNSRYDETSGINVYGMGLKETYANNTSYTITTSGIHTIYGYVKDKAGNTNICSIKIEKRNNLEYQYKKDISAQYSNWSDWSTLTYNKGNPPAFGLYNLIEIVDLGKTTVSDGYRYENGNPIYQDALIETARYKEKTCDDWIYYRLKDTTTTYAVTTTAKWVYAGEVSLFGSPRDTLSVRYTYVRPDYDRCVDKCSITEYSVWKKEVRQVSTVTSVSSIVTSEGVKVECKSYSEKDVILYSPYQKFVGYQQVRTELFKEVYQFKQRTRTLIKAAYTDYKWSVYNDQTLIKAGYAMTGNTRVVD